MASVSSSLQPINMAQSFPLTFENENPVSKILAYDLSHVRSRVINEGSLPESIIDEAIDEYRKFMILISVGFDHLGMCSQEVDEIWHTHLLFTRDYARFCNEIFGEFVHHEPVMDSAFQTDELNSTERFYAVYTQTFGQLSSLWKYSHTSGRAICQPTEESKVICSPTVKTQAICQPTAESKALCIPTVKSKTLCQPTVSLSKIG